MLHFSYIYLMCKFCGYEHGIIGDVVCPIKKNFPVQYASKQIFNDTWPSVMEVSWPIKKIRWPKKDSNSEFTTDINKEDFQKYMNENVPMGGSYQNNFKRK